MSHDSDGICGVTLESAKAQEFVRQQSRYEIYAKHELVDGIRFGTNGNVQHKNQTGNCWEDMKLDPVVQEAFKTVRQTFAYYPDEGMNVLDILTDYWLLTILYKEGFYNCSVPEQVMIVYMRCHRANLDPKKALSTETDIYDAFRKMPYQDRMLEAMKFLYTERAREWRNRSGNFQSEPIKFLENKSGHRLRDVCKLYCSKKCSVEAVLGFIWTLLDGQPSESYHWKEMSPGEARRLADI